VSTALFIKFGGIAVCLFVLAACVCRLDMLKLRYSKLAWILMYILWAIYTGGVLTDLWVGRPVDWYEAAGVFGLLIHICLTRSGWHGGPPPDTNRGALH